MSATDIKYLGLSPIEVAVQTTKLPVSEFLGNYAGLPSPKYVLPTATFGDVRIFRFVFSN